MLLNGSPFPSASLEHAVIPCYKDYEEGSFFYNNGGYVKMGKVIIIILLVTPPQS